MESNWVTCRKNWVSGELTAASDYGKYIHKTIPVSCSPENFSVQYIRNLVIFGLIILLNRWALLAYFLVFIIMDCNVFYPGMYYLAMHTHTYIGTFFSDLFFSLFLVFWMDIGWPLQQEPAVSQVFIVGYYVFALGLSFIFFIYENIYQWKIALKYQKYYFSDKDRIENEVRKQIKLFASNEQRRKKEDPNYQTILERYNRNLPNFEQIEEFLEFEKSTDSELSSINTGNGLSNGNSFFGKTFQLLEKKYSQVINYD